MKKLLVIGAAIVASGLLAGCGHNIVTYGDGVGFETTFRPDSGNFGLTFRYGKILNATLRENAEVAMVGDGKANGGTEGTAGVNTATETSGKLNIKIGRQMTGYYVDAIKAGASQKQLDEYLGGDTPATESEAKQETK